MAERGLISIDGSDVKELADDLKKVEKDLGQQQRKANRQVATTVVAWAQGDARGGTRREAKYATAIKPASTQTTARIRLASTGRNAGANPTFWGANAPSGWYAQPKYAESAGRQHPRWVGNAWIAGRRGEGPHVLNDTVADHMPQIEDLYLAAQEQAFRAAIPRG